MILASDGIAVSLNMIMYPLIGVDKWEKSAYNTNFFGDEFETKMKLQKRLLRNSDATYSAYPKGPATSQFWVRRNGKKENEHSRLVHNMH